ncbi:nucleotidyltransferase family protein [Solicola gregarius]|uniref:NTP transferase domain-containing protein n=1 Tax=Solicola gregarius TaxID=2908642 RepID=A0AA46TKG0_9ACTN|nr:NTP transferase domain-containing protein [Solicola gregarius]UYM06768.1 NTP transferase domain-containing protein [Solicola gregarius]
MSVAGLLLAAGAGTRMGGPKALVEGADGVPWAVSSAQVLRDGGCDEVVVVVGAAAQRVRRVLHDEPVRTVFASSWAEGMGASLRVGLSALATGSRADAVVVHLVDLPDVGADVVGRLVRVAVHDGLARAAYDDGRPGHPVLIGRDHWHGAIAAAVGDRGARDYLAGREVAAIDCSDLATGIDIDSR